MRYLPCREPQSTHSTSRVCSSQAPGLCKFPLLQSYPWIWTHQVTNFVQGKDTGCMHVCVQMCLCMASLQNSVSLKKIIILDRS